MEGERHPRRHRGGERQGRRHSVRGFSGPGGTAAGHEAKGRDGEPSTAPSRSDRACENEPYANLRARTAGSSSQQTATARSTLTHRQGEAMLRGDPCRKPNEPEPGKIDRERVSWKKRVSRSQRSIGTSWHGEDHRRSRWTGIHHDRLAVLRAPRYPLGTQDRRKLRGSATVELSAPRSSRFRNVLAIPELCHCKHCMRCMQGFGRDSRRTARSSGAPSGRAELRPKSRV